MNIFQSALGNQHPRYKAMKSKWETVDDLYSGDIINNMQSYLQQKMQGETRQAFAERSKYAVYVGYFQNIIDSLVGEFSKDTVERDWGLLGDPTVPGSTAFSLYNNIDGTGTNYDVTINNLAINLMLYHEVWPIVEGIDQTGHASVKIVSPLSVPNWDANETWVIEEYQEGNAWDGVQMKHGIISHSADGWQRYREGDGGSTYAVDGGEYEQPLFDDRGQRIKPIFRLSLPMPRYMMYQLAHVAIGILERQSVRDFGLMNTAFNRLLIDGDDELYERVIEQIASGSIAMQGAGHKTLAPSFEGADKLDEVTKDLINSLYRIGFRSLDTTANVVQKTASQSIIERQESTGSFLSLVAASLEEGETKILRMLEQIYFPGQAPQANVTYSSTYGKIEDILENRP